VTESDGTRTFLDFATYRGNTLDEDLRARDFTINAIAYDLRASTIIDPLNGSSDLRAKTIRACLQTSITDDPIRILRAVRQAAAFDFKIERETRKFMRMKYSRSLKGESLPRPCGRWKCWASSRIFYPNSPR
jgi:tRNA nucleotidyltransferase/poly(A) polymerase